MRKIDIEEDIYQYLLNQTQYIGETASEILRRLLDINDDKSKKTLTGKTIIDFVYSSKYKRIYSVVDKFLALLSFIYSDKEESFDEILKLKGRKRLYYSKSFDELKDSGNSAMPRRIPNTPFYVITNNDTPKKKRMIEDVLRRLKYDNKTIKEVVGTLK